jgi:hypothetical protein
MTKKLSDISITLILVICVTVLNGCQLYMEWFVRNYSDKEVLITLRFETKKENYYPDDIPIDTKVVPYKSEIIKIDQSTYSKLRDSLQIIPENDHIYKIILPPRSTVNLTTIIPTRFGNHTNVIAEFEQEGAKYAINSTDVFKKRSALKMSGGFFSKALAYYDYGKTK